MAAPRDRRHISVTRAPRVESYTPHSKKIKQKAIPSPPDRRQHAITLCEELNTAVQNACKRREATPISVANAQPGIYLEFESQAGIELNLISLERRKPGIEVVAVRTVTGEDGQPLKQIATVFVPDGQVKHFLNRIEQYEKEDTKTGKPKHQDFAERIATIRLAALRALWTDACDPFPANNEEMWWEVWLRKADNKALERLADFGKQVGLTIGTRALGFHDRTVVLVRGTAEQLSASLDVLGDLAEVRKARESAAFFVDSDLPLGHLDAWTEDLLHRITHPPKDCSSVCILDTGVTRNHPLLTPLIAAADATSIEPAWGEHDHSGHGTEMAGLAAYGDLAPLFTSNNSVHLRHRIESVKILPPNGQNKPELYGAIMAQAVSLPEITAPSRRRTFSMSIGSTDERAQGQPTSWSAAIDALAAGRMFNSKDEGLVYLDDSETIAPRLFVICAGNIPSPLTAGAYLDRCDVEPVLDPAQAWNALVVGAFTEKAVISDSDWAGWSSVAPAGELSPFSCTSVGFQSAWPIKPDVVFEGGNIAHNGTDCDFPIPDLSLLSTHYQPHTRLFGLSWATSAATAQVARMAAIIMAEYPTFWPETVRALLVHSARWTPAMQDRLTQTSAKKARGSLLRRYGFGVPSLERALRSSRDALTLVVQGTIQPYQAGKMREMHLHDLPWPREVLESLVDLPVKLRVSLSYFVEPNPARRGWKNRHRYASHGLRFDVKLPTETTDNFLKRLNKKALEEEETKPKPAGTAERWFLGEEARNKGSIHSDLWQDTAANLASSGVIAVYPVSGWWKDQPSWDRSARGIRYSLVVSIEAPAANIDLWTPVALELGVTTDAANILIQH